MKKELKVKVKGQKDDIIGHLESIIKHLKEGTLVIQNDNSFVSLKPKDEIFLKIEGEQKEKKEELSIKLSWVTEEKVIEEKAPENLVISSEEPVIEAAEEEAEAEADVTAEADVKTETAVV